MVNIVLPGSNPTFARSGNTVTNTGTFLDIHNIPSDASDLENVGNIKLSRQAIFSPAATGSSSITVPQNVDSVNIVGSSTINNLTIILPMAPSTPLPNTFVSAGANIRLIFDVAVTTLTLTAFPGYTVEAANLPTNVIAGGHYTYELVGTTWKPS